MLATHRTAQWSLYFYYRNRLAPVIQLLELLVRYLTLGTADFIQAESSPRCWAVLVQEVESMSILPDASLPALSRFTMSHGLLVVPFCTA